MAKEYTEMNVSSQSRIGGLEEYLGRPNIPLSRAAPEEILRPLFSVQRIDDSRAMLKYFVRTLK